MLGVTQKADKKEIRDAYVAKTKEVSAICFEALNTMLKSLDCSIFTGPFQIRFNSDGPATGNKTVYPLTGFLNNKGGMTPSRTK